MDNRNPSQNGHRSGLPDISKSTLSATAPIFVPRSYQPPPPPPEPTPVMSQTEEYIASHAQPDFAFVSHGSFDHQTAAPHDTYHPGGHRGGYSGGPGGNYYSNRGNFRGGRGRGRGYRGGRGRSNYHNNTYHGGHHGGSGHHGPPGANHYMVPSQDPVEQVKQVIALLTDNPGMFMDTMQPFTASLASIINSEAELHNIVEELFVQSVRETNFRYTGARMCNYLSQHLHINIPNGSFRSHMLKRCQEEHGKRDQLAQSPATCEQLIGFTLFVGELLVNLLAGEEDQAIKEGTENQMVVAVLTGAIHDLVHTLLTAGFDSCLRCVVQVLKVTGASLDQVESSTNPSGEAAKVDAIFQRIQSLIQEERMQTPSSRSLKVYLQSVVDLRATGWGKNVTDGRPKQPNPYLNMEVPVPLPEPGSGLLYDMGGLPSLPVWSNGSPDLPAPSTPDSQQSHEPYWSPAEEDEYYAFMMAGDREEPFADEMDDEIADAFEEFMRENDARHMNELPK